MMRITGTAVDTRLHLFSALLILLGLSLSFMWPSAAGFSIGGYDGDLPDDDPVDSDELHTGQNAADQYVSLLKRYYRGWGHSRRFPWKRLPHQMCFRQPCKRNRECCYRWNICDRSAHVCVDCWYGSSCKSEQDCCSRYPYCARVWRKSKDGSRYIANGKCVRKL